MVKNYVRVCCNEEQYFSILKGYIRTAVEIKLTLNNFENCHKKIVKIIPSTFFTLKFQWGTFEFLYKKLSL